MAAFDEDEWDCDSERVELKPVVARDAGLYVPLYALDLWRTDHAWRRKSRAVLMLAHIDARVNSYHHRMKDIGEYRAEREAAEEAEKPTRFTRYHKTLWCRLLRCTPNTVYGTAAMLWATRPAVLQSCSLDQGWYLLTTFADRDDLAEGLFVSAPLIRAFEDGSGSLTVTELFLLARIDSFRRSGRPCFLTNHGFAKFLGIASNEVSDLMCRLERIGFISREFWSDGGLQNRTRRTVTLSPRLAR
jgi:uncharacterized protein YjiS (DUF1127 family)